LIHGTRDTQNGLSCDTLQLALERIEWEIVNYA